MVQNQKKPTFAPLERARHHHLVFGGMIPLYYGYSDLGATFEACKYSLSNQGEGWS
jgi:hypothetical protein